MVIALWLFLTARDWPIMKSFMRGANHSEAFYMEGHLQALCRVPVLSPLRSSASWRWVVLGEPDHHFQDWGPLLTGERTSQYSCYPPM